MIRQQPESERPSSTDFTSEMPGLSLGDILRTLRKRYLFIACCAILGALVAGIYVHFATPIYEATGSIRIDPTRASSLGLNELMSVSASAADPLKTEALILHSDAVAIAALQSLPDNEFLELTGYSKAQIGFPAALSTDQQQSDRLNGRAPTLSIQQEGAIALVLREYTVKPVEETQILNVNVREKNPEVAATLANHIILAYLRNTFESRYSSVTQVQTWLQTQLDALKTRAAQSQKRLADFQEQNNIAGTDRSNTVVERLQLLNGRLAEAQGERIIKEARMRAAMDADISTLATLYPNVGLQAIQSQQATVYARYTELSAKFGPNYPPLAEVILQRKQVDEKLAQLVNNTRDRLHQEYQVARDAENLLQQQFDRQTQRVYALNSKQADYAVLQAEGSASRDLYNRLQYQLQQAGISAGLNAVNTMVVNSARSPHKPVEPKKLLSLAMGLVLGLMGGALSAFLFDALGDKLQTVQQAESALGLQAIATIPHEADLQRHVAADGKLKLPMSYRRPSSKISESFRNLRNAIAFSSLDVQPQVILMTSSLAGEGKTVCSANLSIILAQAGANVLVVDGDLRRPRLHAEFALSNLNGLSDLLLARGDVTPALRQPLPGLPNLNVLTAGNGVQFPAEVLASGIFAETMKKWRKEYDFILLDSAPLMVVSDTLPVAKMVDATVLVTRYDTTPVRAAQRSIMLLQRVRAKITGIIINDVPAKGIEYGSYYGYDSSYYSDQDRVIKDEEGF